MNVTFVKNNINITHSAQPSEWKRSKEIIVCLLFSILFNNFCYSQNDANEDSLIKWSVGVNLKWSDFKKESFKKDDISAQTNTIYKITTVDKLENKISIEVSTYFNPNKSWVRTESLRNINLLKHENGHFTIAEIIARKLRRELSTCSVYSIDEAYKIINDAANKYRKELKLIQSIYDKETNHSKDFLNQKKWDEKILIMLDDLNKFSDTRVNIKIL